MNTYVLENATKLQDKNARKLQELVSEAIATIYDHMRRKS